MLGTELGLAGLLERAHELDQLDQAVAVTAAGAPGAVLLEGPAGIGKTALLAAARERAAAAGVRVLYAHGGELESGLGLGIARQLLEPVLVRASDADRARLLARPAAAVAGLFGLDGARSQPPADEYGIQNALYWLCARLAERSPVMIAIDDLQWADPASLRWLGYLLHRLDDLPVLLALARRSDEPGADEGLLACIVGAPVVRVVRPRPLGVRAVARLAHEVFGVAPEDGFARACHRAAGGNPLFTLQLLGAARDEGLRPAGLDAQAAADLAPERISQLVLRRLRRLSPEAVNVAGQVALLGTRAQVRQVRSLSTLTEDQVLAASDELAVAGLLRPGQPLEFVHPVLRSAAYESLAAGRRASGHARAARLLAAEGAPADQVAVHVLRTTPAGDPWVVEILLAAAAADARPESQAAYLRRAIAEPPAAGVRPGILAALGRAESLTFDARAIEHLGEALRLSSDPGLQAGAAGLLTNCLVEHGRVHEAETVLRAAMAGLPGTGEPGSPAREAALALHVALLDADLHASSITAGRLHEAITLAGPGQSAAERDLLCMAAMAAPAAGMTAADVAALAERALHGADLSAGGPRLVHCAVWALEFADRLEEADHWLLRLQDAAQQQDSPGQFMLAASARAEVSFRRGALADAEQDARAALDLARAHGRDYGVAFSAAALVLSLTAQGRLAEADAGLARTPVTQGAPCDLATYVFSRGWLRAAQGRPAEAAEEFTAAGRLTRQAGHDFPGFAAWRVGAATAMLALGRRPGAVSLAREQLDLVRPYGAPGLTGAALRMLGLATGGPAGLDLLAAACAGLDGSPALLERAAAQLEFGAALRRAGRPAQSREPLRAALDLSARCGALPLAGRAREELVAAGGRPRRLRVSGAEALTVSELRVARRAARGHSNREIAQELFVTTKAVEKHLASAYRKLGISGRGSLAGALGPFAEPG